MRGKDASAKLAGAFFGITPAYAGKSDDGHGQIGDRRGSPPRMRGKVPIWGPSSLWRGITPAYAGKSRFQLFIELCFIGSPPRMRGKD